MKVLSIFVISRICHLECHFSTIVAVCDGFMHEADNAYSIQSTWLCYRLVAVRFLKVAYDGRHFILDLSSIDLLLILLLLFFSIWICHFDSVVSLVVERENQALTCYIIFSSCFLVSF